MSEYRLRIATDELERAQRDVKATLLAWKVARAAKPTEIDIESMEALCEAVDTLHTAQDAFDLAQLDAQAMWQRDYQMANRSDRAGEQMDGEDGRSLLGLDASPRASAPPVLRQVRGIRELYPASRED